MTAADIEAAASAAALTPLSPDTIGKFQAYLELLLKWNGKLNLTAIREPEGILHRHFIECIFAAQHLPSGIHTLLDFGSGGGFPGLPIALCRPEIRVTLGESQAKKAAFLREVIRTLGLSNVAVYNGRVEGLSQKFDAVALRAVDRMQEAGRAALNNLVAESYLILFVTQETASDLPSEFGQIEWAPSILLPGSSQRLLLIGRLSR